MKSAAVLALSTQAPSLQSLDPTLGHGNFQYRPNLNWGKLDPGKTPVNDCHEMAIDRRGRIYLCTNETRNNILVYNRDGKLLNAFGNEFPGAHGLTLHDENGEEMLYLADYDRHEVVKMTLEGRVLRVFPFPADAGKYSKKEEFLPTETTVAPNGDVFIADGYGLDYIVHYGPDGSLKNIFGGKGDGPQFLNNAHGIAFDTRDPDKPSLLVTSRVENSLKRFDLDGRHLETFHFPSAWICRPVVSGENVFFAVLVSKMPWDSQSGFVMILDKQNRVVSCPGGSDPNYGGNGKLEEFHQTIKVFKHPHDVLPDPETGDLYVAQWNSGKVYPARLERA